MTNHDDGQCTAPTTAEPITSDVAIGWFRDATTKRHPNVPTAAHVWSLVRVVNELRQSKYSDRQLKIIDAPLDRMSDLDELTNPADIKEAVALQHSLRDLQKHLPSVIDMYQSNELDPEVTHKLKELLHAMTALKQVASDLFDPPKPGGREKGWHIQAHMLRGPIEHVWKQVGRERLSNKRDGPLVKVLSCAITVVRGEPVSRQAISTELKRDKRRKGIFVER